VFLDRGVPADALAPDVLQQTLATNLFGAVVMCGALLDLVPRGGRIINVSSTLGQLERGIGATGAAYAISKTALNAYTSALAAAVRERGILVDAMHPGWIKTDMGGPGAPLEPEAATETALFLATRAPGETGRLWNKSALTAW
jgi:NAD(P)-dependent dehydrogenase (short-subunit alcohol dehydrogenase family)